MLALFVVVAIVVVAGIAVLVVRDRPLIADDPVGSRSLAWSARDGVSPQDLAEVRFAVALRGYRMEEVDRVLDDTRQALAERDTRIADLQRVVAALGGAPVPTAAAADRSPAGADPEASAPSDASAPSTPDLSTPDLSTPDLSTPDLSATAPGTTDPGGLDAAVTTTAPAALDPDPLGTGPVDSADAPTATATPTAQFVRESHL